MSDESVQSTESSAEQTSQSSLEGLSVPDNFNPSEVLTEDEDVSSTQGESGDEASLAERLETAEKLSRSYEANAKRFENLHKKLSPSVISALEKIPLEEQDEFIQRMINPETGDIEGENVEEQGGEERLNFNWNDKQNILDNFLEHPTETMIANSGHVFDHKIKQFAEGFRKEMAEMYGGIMEREKGILLKEGQEELIAYAKSRGVELSLEGKDAYREAMDKKYSENPEYYEGIPQGQQAKVLFDDVYLDAIEASKKANLDTARQETASFPTSGIKSSSSAKFMDLSPKHKRREEMKQAFISQLKG